MVPASSSRPRRSAALARAAATVAAVAVAAALVAVAAAPATAAANPPLADAAVAAVVPDPSPSLRGVGDTLYTTLKSNATTTPVFGARSSGTSVIKAGLSEASHAVSNALTAAEDPLGTVAMASHLKVDAAEFSAWNASAKTCSPNNASFVPKPRLSFAFQGSGLLLPFYQGVVQGLQDSGVLTPAVMRTAAFAGGSGGSLTSVLTALGWPGRKQFAAFAEILGGITKCKDELARAGESEQEQRLRCTLNTVGLPIVARKIKADNPDAAAEISNRVTIWACQVNTLSTSIAKSVALGTSKWTSVEDIVSNVAVSDMIPCFSQDSFYNQFRGSAFIDAGYCADFEQFCPGGLATPVTAAGTKCLKVSTAFLGPNLRGTPFPTKENCNKGYNGPADFLPNVGKGYYTPANESDWKLKNGDCRSQADQAAAGVTTTQFVPHGVTARPDIHPTFYSPLPAAFASGCEWLRAALVDGGDAQFDAIFEHGVEAGRGWAEQNGYCA